MPIRRVIPQLILDLVRIEVGDRKAPTAEQFPWS
jgi:hypothetical protein